MDPIHFLLRSARTIAIVGLSDKPHRDSYRVAAYLQGCGYRIIPVNPNITEVLGAKAYPSLKDVPEPIDIVDVFRRPDAVPEIIDDAIAVNARAVWMQLGVTNQAAAATARAAGLQVVMDKCIKIEHMRM